MIQATTTTTDSCIKNTTDVWHLTPPANINTNTSTACDTSRIKVDLTDTMVLRKMRRSYVYNSNPPSHIMCQGNNIVLTITTAIYAGSVCHVLH